MTGFGSLSKYFNFILEKRNNRIAGLIIKKSAERLKARLSAGVTIQHLQPPSLLFGQRLGPVQSHQLYPEPPQVSAAVAPRVTERSQHITAQSGGSGSTQLARCTRRALGHGHRSDTWIFRFMPGTTLFGDGNNRKKKTKTQQHFVGM